jgi:ssDNA-binding Zn-finger/Zn-ribbon topoisomerase 1
MSIFKKLFGQNEETTSSSINKSGQPKFIRKDRNQGATYETYKGKDAETAKEFLMTKRVDEQKYYIIVETPEGNWGLDVKGLYLERLLPFQKDINSAKCEGSTCVMPDMFGLQMAARGVNDNFIAKVECGNCKHQWHDGLRYQNITVVRCPECKTFNKINSGSFNVILI